MGQAAAASGLDLDQPQTRYEGCSLRLDFHEPEAFALSDEGVQRVVESGLSDVIMGGSAVDLKKTFWKWPAEIRSGQVLASAFAWARM